MARTTGGIFRASRKLSRGLNHRIVTGVRLEHKHKGNPNLHVTACGVHVYKQIATVIPWEHTARLQARRRGDIVAVLKKFLVLSWDVAYRPNRIGADADDRSSCGYAAALEALRKRETVHSLGLYEEVRRVRKSAPVEP